MADTSQNNSGTGGAIIIAIVFALVAILSGAGGCGGNHRSTSSSKYTQKELEDAHELYELREEMISNSKKGTKR